MLLVCNIFVVYKYIVKPISMCINKGWQSLQSHSFFDKQITVTIKLWKKWVVNDLHLLGDVVTAWGTGAAKTALDAATSRTNTAHIALVLSYRSEIQNNNGVSSFCLRCSKRSRIIDNVIKLWSKWEWLKYYESNSNLRFVILS